MKKLLALTVIFSLFSNVVFAEMLCTKNSQNFKVKNGKVKFKASKVLKAGSTCPSGYSALASIPDTPVNYTGVWNLAGAAGQSYAASSISFPTALAAMPTQVVFVAHNSEDATCTGSVNAPTAPTGTLCIYEQTAFNLDTDFITRYRTYSGTDAIDSASVSSIYGAALYGYVESLVGGFYAWGTWAVAE